MWLRRFRWRSLRLARELWRRLNWRGHGLRLFWRTGRRVRSLLRRPGRSRPAARVLDAEAALVYLAEARHVLLVLVGADPCHRCLRSILEARNQLWNLVRIGRVLLMLLQRLRQALLAAALRLVARIGVREHRRRVADPE